MPANDLSLRSAVNDLYCDHHGWLNGWLRKRLGNAFDAADLTQDTFVRVIKARSALDIREPRPYLSRIAKGLLIDLIRRRSLEQAYLEALATLPEALQAACGQPVLPRDDAALARIGARPRLPQLAKTLPSGAK